MCFKRIKAIAVSVVTLSLLLGVFQLGRSARLQKCKEVNRFCQSAGAINCKFGTCWVYEGDQVSCFPCGPGSPLNGWCDVAANNKNCNNDTVTVTRRKYENCIDICLKNGFWVEATNPTNSTNETVTETRKKYEDPTS